MPMLDSDQLASRKDLTNNMSWQRCTPAIWTMLVCSASSITRDWHQLLVGMFVLLIFPMPALHCSIAGQGASLAFPEAKLGIIPGAGGTQVSMAG
eukprot:1157862-Pelagomonas_calceolata.AAC.4